MNIGNALSRSRNFLLSLFALLISNLSFAKSEISTHLDDINPPVIVKIFPEEYPVEVGDNYWLMISSTDVESGLSEHCSGVFYLNSENRPESGAMHLDYFYNHRYSRMTANTNKYMPSGEYYLAKLTIQDRSGNKTSLSANRNDSVYKGTNIPVHRIWVLNDLSYPDSTKPVVSTISLARTQIDAGENIELNVTVSEDLSGVSFLNRGELTLLSDNSSRNEKLYLDYFVDTVGDDQYTISTETSNYLRAGEYYLSNLRIKDRAGNTTVLTSDGSSDTFYGTDLRVPRLIVANKNSRLKTHRSTTKIQIAAGDKHTCALKDGVVTCWGDIENPPRLISPRAISSGGGKTCALDDTGVVCWGDSRYGQLDVPPLSSPKQITAGTVHACALDANGVECWGYSSRIIVPELTAPTHVAAGNHTCAIDANGVQCWGDNNGHDRLDPPPMNSPRQLAAGRNHTCAVHADGVSCWGNQESNMSNPPPDFIDPRQVMVGRRHACAIDEVGLACWGSDNFGAIYSPYVFDGYQVSGGWGHGCVVDYNGVQCWGLNDRGQTDVPQGFINIQD
jgi:hypothetical protein